MTVAKQSTIQLLGVRGVQIGVALFVLQQFAGINAVMYFSTQVFKEVSASDVLIVVDTNMRWSLPAILLAL